MSDDGLVRNLPLVQKLAWIVSIGKRAEVDSANHILVDRPPAERAASVREALESCGIGFTADPVPEGAEDASNPPPPTLRINPTQMKSFLESESVEAAIAAHHRARSNDFTRQGARGVSECGTFAGIEGVVPARRIEVIGKCNQALGELPRWMQLEQIRQQGLNRPIGPGDAGDRSGRKDHEGIPDYQDGGKGGAG